MTAGSGLSLQRSVSPRTLMGTGLAMLLAAGLAAGGEFLPALGVLSAAGAFLIYTYPGLGLVVLSALAVTNVSDNLITAFGAPSIAQAAGPGLAAILLARWLVLNERPFFDTRAILLFSAYALVLMMSAVWATSWTASMGTAIDFLKDIVIVVLTLAFFNRPGALGIYLHAGTAFLAAICALCLWQYLTGDFSNDYFGFARVLYDSNRLAGPINDPNFFAATLVFFVPLLTGYVLFGKTWAVSVTGLVLLAIFLTAIMLTASRGALVALAAVMGLFVLLLDRRTIAPALLLGGVLAIALGYVLSDAIVERFELIFAAPGVSATLDPAIEGRLASWSVAIHLFQNNPLGGVGAGNYNLHFQDSALDLGLIFRGEARSAHSLYLEILAETGIVGMAVFAAIMAGAFIGVIRSIRLLRAADLPQLARFHATFGIGLAGYLVAMIFLHDSYPRLLYTLLAVGIALPSVARLEIAHMTRQQREA